MKGAKVHYSLGAENSQFQNLKQRCRGGRAVERGGESLLEPWDERGGEQRERIKEVEEQ